MIYNERQLKISAAELNKLIEARAELEESSASTEEWLKDAQLNALSSQIAELRQDIAEYNLLRSGQISHEECNDLSELPRALIAARISQGFSQKDLADQLGMQQQQIQRYEATYYMSASLSRLIEIAGVLDLKVKELWPSRAVRPGNVVFSWSDSSHVDWNLFPMKEMARRGWLDFDVEQSPIAAVKDYFFRAAGPEFASALHRKKFYGERKPNKYSLLAWQARILEKARAETDEEKIGSFELDDRWVTELVKLSTKEHGPLLAKDFLASHGVSLVIEHHLSETYLDGAAMLSHEGNPVIGLTLRHDRLDNFWFVLLHELGHVFLHLFNSLKMDFFDEESGEDADDIEREADEFALNASADDESWSSCLSRFYMTEDSVIQDAKRLEVHPSIVAGRLRRERRNYTILNELIGLGEVRREFGVEV